MSMFFDNTLWILGDVPTDIIQPLLDDGWTLVASTKMGMCLTLCGNYRSTGLPRFENHPHLLCVLSTTHEASPDNHRLCVAEHDDYVEAYFDNEGTVCEVMGIPAEKSKGNHSCTNKDINSSKAEPDNIHDSKNSNHNGCEPDTCDSLNAAEDHLSNHPHIPAVLRPAIFQAEANFRMNRGDVMAVACIDKDRKMVDIPDGLEKEELFRFLWDSLVAADGASIQFAFATDDEQLAVIYMSQKEGYFALAPVEINDKDVAIGNWNIQQMERN